MNHLAQNDGDPAPLDFNAQADTVADATDLESWLPENSGSQVPELVLAEIGLPVHLARRLVVERSLAVV